jgi:hypothetical protein
MDSSLSLRVRSDLEKTSTTHAAWIMDAPQEWNRTRSDRSLSLLRFFPASLAKAATHTSQVLLFCCASTGSKVAHRPSLSGKADRFWTWAVPAFFPPLGTLRPTEKKLFHAPMLLLLIQSTEWFCCGKCFLGTPPNCGRSWLAALLLQLPAAFICCAHTTGVDRPPPHPSFLMLSLLCC